jgi:hypothetical protein
MSLILAPSAEELMQPGFGPRGAMARPEILLQTPTLSLISSRSERRQQILP